MGRRQKKRPGGWLTITAMVRVKAFDTFEALARRMDLTRASLGGAVITAATPAIEQAVAEWGERAVGTLLKSGEFRLALVDLRGPGEDPALAIAFEAADRLAAGEPPESEDLSYTPPLDVVIDGIVGGAALGSDSRSTPTARTA